MDQLNQPEWITFTQASKAFGRSRQAIEKLVKEGKIEAKQLGPKLVLHVHRPTLALRYANQVAHNTLNISNQVDTSIYNQPSLVLEAVTLKAECNRLAELFRRVEDQLAETKKERNELRLQLRDLEKERSQHLAEMRALLSKDARATDGVISRWLRR